MPPSDFRTVHGVAADGAHIVRYDRASRWYLEPVDGSRRTKLTIGQAVAAATAPGARVRLGRAGGTTFDARVRRTQQRAS